MQKTWQALADASLAGAVDESEPPEVAETFTPSPIAPGSLETIAYMAEASGIVEYGTPDPTATITQGTSLSSASGCLRGTRDNLGEVQALQEDGKFVFPPASSLAGGGLVAAAAPPTTSVVRYRTFISKAKVSAPTCGTFKGDNRGFSSYYDKPNRTRASVFFNWPTRTINTTKHVGATKKLNSAGSVIKTATASSKGIKFDTPSILPTYGRIHLNHSVSNPLCARGGPISYSVVIEAWKDGSARIAGTRKDVPNHEAYVYPTSGAYGNTIFRRSTTDFFCLSGPCGNESIWEVSP